MAGFRSCFVLVGPVRTACHGSFAARPVPHHRARPVRPASLHPLSVGKLRRMLGTQSEATVVLGVMYTLDGIAQLEVEDVYAALQKDAPAIRVHAMRLAERWFDEHPKLVDETLQLADDNDPRVLIQLALSLGESNNDRVVPTLARLVQEHSDIRWMHTAVLHIPIILFPLIVRRGVHTVLQKGVAIIVRYGT